MGAANSFHKDPAFRDLLPKHDIKKMLTDGGTWKVARTSRPYWLKDNRFLPTLSYDVDSSDDNRVFDTVRYFDGNNKNKEEIIKGTDSWSEREGCPAYVLWRGTGALRAISLEWYVIHTSSSTKTTISTSSSQQDDEKDKEVPKYIVVYFMSTTFTPEGMDVLMPVSSSSNNSATTTVNEAEVDEIVAEVRKKFPGLALLDELRSLPTNGTKDDSKDGEE